MRRLDDFKLVSLWFEQAALLWLHSKLRLHFRESDTSYSSPSYRHCIPFDKSKIDRSDIGEPEDSFRSSRPWCTWPPPATWRRRPKASNPEAQREVLQKLGCSQMQGWLFSPAVPAAKLKQLLSAQAAAA
jgi:predicted signal transduction protein with EAL and GGDEF domain